MVLIKELEIKNSPFFGERFRVEFSPKLNCLMGGRGTGKTTILNLLHWVVSKDEDLPRELLTRVKANLGTGTVEAKFSDNLGNEFTAVKIHGESPVVKDVTGKQILLEDFTGRIAVDFVAAGTIENIGKEPALRLSLLDGFIGKEVADISGKIGYAVAQLKQSEIQIKSGQRELSQAQDEVSGMGEVEADLEKARAELASVETDAGIKEQFEIETGKQTKRQLEQNYLLKLRDGGMGFVQAVERLRAATNQLQLILAANAEADGPTLKAFAQSGKTQIEAASGLVDSLQSIAKEYNAGLAAASKATKDEHEKADGVFSSLKQTVDKHRELFLRINLLSQKVTAKKVALERIKLQSEQLKALLAGRKELASGLNALVAQRTDMRRARAASVNDLLGQKIKILIQPSALNAPLATLLEAVLAKMQKRMTGTERRILEVSTPQALLADIEKNAPEEYAKKTGIESIERVRDLFKGFKDSQLIYELESCVCEDSPNFFLAIEDDKKTESLRATEELSMGQRCTAVLPILFAMTNKPLLIDQPEDNLDNRYITQSIHKIIRAVKETRQLIFVTHNPNIPVISDAENNTFLIYANRHSQVHATGAIKDVAGEIVDLLEGGAAAFIERKKIYGY
jgi:energy-coupling factor transporter ATP-binding protein EcfA2